MTIEDKVVSAVDATLAQVTAERDELRRDIAHANKRADLREVSGTLARVVDLAENLSDRDLEDLAGKVREISRSRPGMS